MNFKLSQSEKDRFIKDIQIFFEEERDEEIGVIAAEMLLDFFLENIGKNIYNKALDNSKLWFNQRLNNLTIDFDLLYK